MKHRIQKAILLIPILLLLNAIPIQAETNIENNLDENNPTQEGTVAVTLDVTHTHSYDTAFVIKPSCTTNGYTKSICNICGAEKVNHITPMLNHNWLEYETILKCTQCGLTKITSETDADNTETMMSDSNNKDSGNNTETDSAESTEPIVLDNPKDTEIVENIETDNPDSESIEDSTEIKEDFTEDSKDDDNYFRINTIITITVSIIIGGTIIGGTIFVFRKLNKKK